MVPFAGLLAALEQIPDPRRRQGQRYSLAPLLLFAVLAVLAGATSSRRVRLFIGVHRERLNAVFGAGFRRAPAVNTLRTLFHARDPTEIEAAFRAHAEQLGNATAAPGRLAMRSQPHRIVLGEVRGTEAVHLLEAMNTGHAGTICTVHSNGGRAALRRLHLLARRAVPGYLIEEIEEAVDAVVQLAVEDGRRRVTGVWRGPGGAAGAGGGTPGGGGGGDGARPGGRPRFAPARAGSVAGQRVATAPPRRPPVR